VYKGWWLDRFVFAEVNKNRDGPDGVANMMNMMDMLQNNIEFFLDHTGPDNGKDVNTAALGSSGSNTGSLLRIQNIVSGHP